MRDILKLRLLGVSAGCLWIASQSLVIIETGLSSISLVGMVLGVVVVGLFAGLKP